MMIQVLGQIDQIPGKLQFSECIRILLIGFLKCHAEILEHVFHITEIDIIGCIKSRIHFAFRIIYLLIVFAYAVFSLYV